MAQTTGNSHLDGGRPLGLAHAIGQALAVGPIASVGVGAYLVAGHAGPATPSVVLVSTVAVLAYAWAVSLHGRYYAGAGGVYDYIARAHGRRLGVGSALLYFFSLALVYSGLAVIAGLLIEGFAVGRLDVEVGWWTGAVAGAVIAFALVHRGAGLSTRLQLILTAASLIPFVLLVIAILAGGEAQHSLSAFDPTEAPEFFRAVLFALVLFGGFEAATNLGEEERRPHVAIPRALLITVLGCATFYFVVLYAATAGFGPDRIANTWGQNPFALTALADQQVGEPAGAFMEIAIIVDILVILTALANALARGLMALARDGLLPAALARRSARGTPTAGAAVPLAATLVALPIVGLLLEERFRYFDIVALAGVLVAVPVPITLALGSARLLLAERRARWRLVLPPLAATVPVLGVYGVLSPLPTGPERAGIWIAVGVAAAAALTMLVARARDPDILREAGRHVLVAEPVGPPGPRRTN